MKDMHYYGSVLILVFSLMIISSFACGDSTVNTEPSISNEADESLEHGIVLVNTGQPEAAIIELTKTIEIDPGNAEAYFYRGNAYADKGDNKKAISDYTKSIELDPVSTNAYYNRGISYSDIHDYEKAIDDYNKTIELDPDYAEAYYNRGLIYGIIGDDDSAIINFTRAIEIRPDFANGYGGRGIAYSRKDEAQNAIADFIRCIELDPASDPVGAMTTYQGERIPLSIELPASWDITIETPTPGSPYPLVLGHSEIPGSQLTITEPTFEELLLSEMSLDEYADNVIETNREYGPPDFTLISQNMLGLRDEVEIKLITFSSNNGQRIFYRTIYIYNDGPIFNITYTYRPLLNDIRHIIYCSLSTLRINKP
jgi:tetratricopeptide (TPR) repeat protein